MSRPSVLVTREIIASGIEILEKECNVEIYRGREPMGREKFLAGAAGKDAVLCQLTDRIDSDFFEAVPSIRGVANYAVGYDNMDVEEATRRGIPLSNTPGVLTEATAEMAWTLLFAVSRRVVEADRYVRSGNWKSWDPLFLLGHGITGRTLGIVGPGRIGSAMAMMSRGFNMKVLYSGNRNNPELDRELNAEFVPFSRLVRESDFISLHVPFWSETRHMFNESVFREMKKSAVIVNTARGPVINENDLVNALKSGEIAGAGLDVFEFEPEVTEELKQLNNVVVTPHTGSATVRTRAAMSVMAAENIIAMLAGQKPPQCINPEIFE